MSSRPSPRSGASIVSLFAILLLAALGACDKVPLLAPTESTITLSATNAFVPVNGSTEIIATVIEQSGTPVHNGTLVTFSTTIGRVEPQEARTQNGTVRVRLHVGTQSGVARVTAVSGGATAEALEIQVGAAAAARIVLNAAPATVPSSGGSVQLTAVVTDETGNRLSGVPVTFSTTAGSLSASTVVTDQNGEARATLNTNREATVTATAGNQQQQVTVSVNAAPGVTISAETTTPTAGQPTVFSITATQAAGGGAIQNVTVDFGDGGSQSLGSLNGTTRVTHVYRSPGTYTVTATATDSSGERTSVSTVITVSAAAPLAVTITASTANPTVNTAVTFTANVTPTTTPIARYEWRFGDSGIRTTTGPQTSFVFTTPGPKQVSVRAVAVDGTSGTGIIDIFVQPATP